jgi:hypothetical protein
MKKAILVPEDETVPMSIVEVDGSLDDYYRVLGCSMIEEIACTVRPGDTVIGDEEAKLSSRLVNKRMTALRRDILLHGDVFAGPGLIIGDGEEEWVSLVTPEDALVTYQQATEQWLTAYPGIAAGLDQINETIRERQAG